MDRFIRRSSCATRREPPGAAQSKLGRRPGTEPPLKRLKTEEAKSGDGDGESPQSVHDEDGGEESPSLHGLDLSRQDSAASDAKRFADEVSVLEHETTIENSLPHIETGVDAINEYTALRASQLAEGNPADKAAVGNEGPQWAKGKSSIYVDAFNLALDTVLEDEAHLFDEKEIAVFDQWKSLSYETQYL